ncbi:DUF4279 domain-containing protein [Puniceicoccus vermicola]|uniref:DUF4279 domain-containing protein n=1 Tax=Puniceicoccus vermicola TaxID=388746 RepID=A0A7X1AZR2_9BACT|nr:DUF4279 domain-containing protein [Puniceicoccus vermicola]MBC2601860.1 DUF4279 domain-containing protein [Puniceicoccus vermicola]
MNQPPEKLVSSAPEGTVWFGGPVDRSTMSLRIFGESVDPKEITALLGHEPTKGRTKGEKWIGPKSGRQYEAKKGSWSLSAPDSSEADIDSQVEWILSRLTKDLGVWKKITGEYDVDLFSGLFLEAMNRGISISPTTMKEISSRGIELGFDIYSFEPEEADQ